MAQTETEIVQGIGSDYAIKYGFKVPEDYFFKSGRGLSHELIDAISSHKNEPDWMRKFRHESLDNFLRRLELSEAPNRRVLKPVVECINCCPSSAKSALIFWLLLDQAKSNSLRGN